jgi:LL-diaminopimelate aminotransferase
MKRNAHMASLKANYLFPEVNARKQQFMKLNPKAELISLGVGDTSEPIPESITASLVAFSAGLGTLKGYSGYGPEHGKQELRELIAEKIYQNKVSAADIFVSDGAKCDLGRLQKLFGGDVTVAVQDPAYPVYVDGSLIQGVKNIVFMPCHPGNNFFPDLANTPKTDLIYFCSPNNPTGAVASRQQLKELVDFATKNGSIIIFDSAYANYIQDPSLPKSIYEIEGAEKVAIEVGSFSKLAGFSGVRLAWTIVPEGLMYDDGTSVKADWNRITSTIFNGASNISQAGGCAVLQEQGLKEISVLTSYYLENARLLKLAFEERGWEVFGGVNAPYLWVRFPGRDSWDMFQEFLAKYQLITTPGVGFGPTGKEFLRMTAFGHREVIQKAVDRIRGA